MVGLNLTPGLTRPLGEAFEENLVRSHQGMAHFAGTGPFGATCRRCAFWGNSGKDSVRPASCAKFKQITGKQGHTIPHDASACKYFEAAQ